MSPHSSGPLGLRTIARFRENPMVFLTQLAQEQPEVAEVRFGPKDRMFVVTRPSYVHDLLQRHWEVLHKWERQAGVAGRVLGTNAMAIMDGDAWQQNRKLVAPAFHVGRLDEYLKQVLTHTSRTLERWQDDTVVDIDAEMTAATMGIIGQILFGIQNFEQDAAGISEALGTLRHMLMLDSTSLVRLPRWLPVPRFRREAAAMQLTNSMLFDIIRGRRASGEDAGDMLSALLESTDETGAGLEDAHIRDTLMGLFIAGHETTAVMMTWIVYLLARHPEIQERVAAETTAQPMPTTLEDLGRLTYSTQVMLEALRLYPPAWSLFMRKAIARIDLGDHSIPEGGVVVISPWVIHHQPGLWEDPERFDPSRFEGRYKDRQEPYSFIPFGGGPRICAGARMAEMEGAAMMWSLTRQFRFTLDNPEAPIGITPRFTSRPSRALPVRVHRRQRSVAA